MSRTFGAQDLRDRRRRQITIGLSIALCALLVNAIVGENGALSAVRLKAEKAALEAAVAALRHDNRRLQQEGQRLQTDPAALEETARRTLGALRPGETLVIVRDRKPGETAAPK